ncbi:MAG: hypothetical protein OXC53_07055, partial [Rhodobacteraceae bacterium]|nr:hypothetical protein [Paracoccaceae bacterium]
MMDIFGNLPELPPRDEKISRTWGGGTAVLYNGAVKPGVIPATTQTRYISCLTALNIRQLWEDTGDWHQHTALFVPASKPDVELPCVGTGEDIDTTPSLGSTGVRDMKRALDRLYKREIAEPIWVANHFRAIADIVMMDQITLMNLHRMRP